MCMVRMVTDAPIKHRCMYYEDSYSAGKFSYTEKGHSVSSVRYRYRYRYCIRYFGTRKYRRQYRNTETPNFIRYSNLCISPIRLVHRRGRHFVYQVEGDHGHHAPLDTPLRWRVPPNSLWYVGQTTRTGPGTTNALPSSRITNNRYWQIGEIGGFTSTSVAVL